MCASHISRSGDRRLWCNLGGNLLIIGLRESDARSGARIELRQSVVSVRPMTPPRSGFNAFVPLLALLFCGFVPLDASVAIGRAHASQSRPGTTRAEEPDGQAHAAHAEHGTEAARADLLALLDRCSAPSRSVVSRLRFRVDIETNFVFQSKTRAPEPPRRDAALFEVLRHPDGRVLVRWSALNPNNPDAAETGTAFRSDGAVERRADGTLLLSREGDILWAGTGLGLLDQSGDFIWCTTIRCGLRQRSLMARSVSAQNDQWVLDLQRETITLSEDPTHRGNISHVESRIVVQDREVLRARYEVTHWTEVNGRVAPQTVRYSAVRAPDLGQPPDARYGTASSSTLRLMGWERLEPEEFDGIWTTFHTLATGQEVHAPSQGLVGRGGSRVFSIDDVKYLDMAPWTSALLPPIEELLSRSRKLE